MNHQNYVDKLNYIGSGGAAGQMQATSNQTSPPSPTRFSSIAGRLESQVNHLFSCIERANRLADRLGGAIPQEVAKSAQTANSGNVAAIIEEENERFDTALRSLMNVLDRLEQL